MLKRKAKILEKTYFNGWLFTYMFSGRRTRTRNTRPLRHRIEFKTTQERGGHQYNRGGYG
jgi:hypothetical protein